jgi:acetylglutamate kinase
MMERAIEKAAVLIEALPYIKQFRHKIVVVKLGGAAMVEEKALHSVVHDIVFMEQVGMYPLIVHGGGPKISAAMKEAGITPRFINGQRFTDKTTLDIVARVLIGELSADIVRRIDQTGGVAVAVNGRDSGFLRARKRQDKDQDLGQVGEATGLDTELALRMLGGDIIPVVAPIGRGEDGQLYNINADLAAAKIAQALQAEKLVFLSDVPGIMTDVKDSKSLKRSVTEGQVKEMIAGGQLDGGMLPKVEAGLASLRAGVNKVHMISGMVQHSLLLEIFTDRGVGTQMIHG